MCKRQKKWKMPAKEGGLVTELQDLLLNVQKGFSEF